MTSPLVGYEDHIPASALAAVGVTTYGEADDECFVCGQEWPCGKAIAYNDGLKDGATQERTRIVAALRAEAIRDYWPDKMALLRTAANMIEGKSL